MKSLDGVGGHVQNTMLALNRKCHIYVSTFREGIINKIIIILKILQFKSLACRATSLTDWTEVP